MARPETGGSGAWLLFLIGALVAVLGVIGYLISKRDLFGRPLDREVPRTGLPSTPSPEPLPLPRPVPPGRITTKG